MVAERAAEHREDVVLHALDVASGANAIGVGSPKLWDEAARAIAAGASLTAKAAVCGVEPFASLPGAKLGAVARVAAVLAGSPKAEAPFRAWLADCFGTGFGSAKALLDLVVPALRMGHSTDVAIELLRAGVADGWVTRHANLDRGTPFAGMKRSGYAVSPELCHGYAPVRSSAGAAVFLASPDPPGTVRRPSIDEQYASAMRAEIRAMVCPRCLGVEPGKPAGNPDKPHPGPFTSELCDACTDVLRRPVDAPAQPEPDTTSPEPAKRILARRRPVGGVHPKQRERLVAKVLVAKAEEPDEVEAHRKALATLEIEEEDLEKALEAKGERESAAKEKERRTREQIAVLHDSPKFGSIAGGEYGAVVVIPKRPEGTRIHVFDSRRFVGSDRVRARCRIEVEVRSDDLEWTILLSKSAIEVCAECDASHREKGQVVRPGYPAIVRPDQIYRPKLPLPEATPPLVRSKRRSAN